ncbi:hypothetical protein G9A89_023383 [Geosiphon pyriformis]|nr:hypothetical protein G9A89_023383 [Geosiphon pyriformis]
MKPLTKSLNRKITFLHSILKPNQKSLVKVHQEWILLRPYSTSGTRANNANERDYNEKITIEKERVIKGEVKSRIGSAPGWSEILASESEAMIKADRHPIDHTSIEQLQRESAKVLHLEHDNQGSDTYQEAHEMEERPKLKV